MKQETGSSISVSNNEVSIQLPLGGHSFSVAALDDALGGEHPQSARCTVLTPRTTLVPRECFDASSAEKYLRIAGVPCRGDETVVTCDAEAQRAVAVMAVSSECLGALRERFGERLSFASPLCDSRDCKEPAVLLHRAGDLIYIKVYGPELQLAEAVEISSDADVLQLLHDLEGALEVSRCAVVCSGDDCDRLCRRLAKYYTNVRCE